MPSKYDHDIPQRRENRSCFTTGQSQVSVTRLHKARFTTLLVNFHLDNGKKTCQIHSQFPLTIPKFAGTTPPFNQVTLYPTNTSEKNFAPRLRIIRPVKGHLHCCFTACFSIFSTAFVNISYSDTAA